MAEPRYRKATSWFTDRRLPENLSAERFLHSRAIGRGVRVAVVLPVVMGSFALAGVPRASFLGAFAVITLLVTSDFSGPRRERAASMGIIASAGAFTLVLGASLAGNLWLLIPTALVLGMAVVLVGALRGFLSQGTVPILLPFFIAATANPPLGAALEMLAGWIIGSIVAILAAVLLWPYFPRRVITESLTDSMVDQADLMTALWAEGATQASVASEYVKAEAQVSRTLELYSGRLRRPGSAYRRERFLVRLVEETRRLRLALRMAYRRLPLSPAPGDREVIAVAAQAMRTAAAHARAGEADLAPFYRLDAARVTHRADVAAAVREDLLAGNAAAVQNNATSAFRPRVVSLLAETAVRDAGVMHGSQRVPHLTIRGRRLPTVVGLVDPWHRFRAELSWRAPWGRNALRLGIAVSVALTVVTLTGVDRGYWVVLGALSVLRMDLRGTGRTSWQVIQGQLLGFAIGFGLLAVLGERAWLWWLLLPMLAGLQGYMANNVAVVWQQAGFTALLVNLVSLSSPDRSIVFLRLEDVALGVVVAVTVSLLVFPRGLVPRVGSALITAMSAANDFLADSVHTVAARSAGEAGPFRADGAQARKSVERASETIDLALTQGLAQDGRVLLWQRLLVMAEYVTYIAEVIDAVGQEYPADEWTAKAGAALVAAVDDVRPRLIADVERTVKIAEEVGVHGLADLPDYQNTGEFSGAIRAALKTIDDVVAHWAASRQGAMAETCIELYWTLGWLSEVDLMIENNHALAAALETTMAGRSA